MNFSHICRVTMLSAVVLGSGCEPSRPAATTPAAAIAQSASPRPTEPPLDSLAEVKAGMRLDAAISLLKRHGVDANEGGKEVEGPPGDRLAFHLIESPGANYFLWINARQKAGEADTLIRDLEVQKAYEYKSQQDLPGFESVYFDALTVEEIKAFRDEGKTPIGGYLVPSANAPTELKHGMRLEEALGVFKQQGIVTEKGMRQVESAEGFEELTHWLLSPDSSHNLLISASRKVGDEHMLVRGISIGRIYKRHESPASFPVVFDALSIEQVKAFQERGELPVVANDANDAKPAGP